MAIVHCRQYHAPDWHPDDGWDLPDGYVWLCLGAMGAEDAPGDRLEHYHNAVPLLVCSCGYNPIPYGEPQPDGYWHPAGHP